MTTTAVANLMSPLTAPPIGSSFVTVQNGHLALDGKRFAGFGMNVDWWAILGCIQVGPNKTMVPYPNGRSLMATYLDNLVNMGIRVVRIHSQDSLTGSNLFCATNGPQTTTRKLDPASMELLSWFFYQCKIRNIRIIMTMHFARQLVPVTDQPSIPSPMFTECSTSPSPFNGKVALMNPWFWYDAGLQSLHNEFNSQVLTYVSQYTGLALGKDPVLLAVILQNETSLAKNVPWSYSATKYPLLSSTYDSMFNAWSAANKSVPAGAYQHNVFAIQLETQVLQAEAAAVRAVTSALVIAGTYFGNAPYGMVKTIHDAGDIVDFHIYSRGPLTDPNRLISGYDSNSKRTGFSAVAAGCTIDKPVVCTEWGPVSQSSPNTRDSDAERATTMSSVVNAAIQQDVDVICLYSYLHNPINSNPQYWNPGAYDFIDDFVLFKGIRSAVAAFHDLDLRPTTATQLPLTAAKYYGLQTGSQYAQPSGPYYDQDLYAVPQSTKIQMVLQ